MWALSFLAIGISSSIIFPRDGLPKESKILLIESEMKGPKGHFLDNLIESTKNFEKKLKIYWILNKKFNSEGTYIPKNIKIFRSISTNKFNRKKNKLLYL